MKGYYDSVDSLVEQADLFIGYISEQYENVKIFIAGHSMGGLVCFRLSIKYPQRFAGTILLAPAIR
jgi:acylglycerol lipase